jgi:hypothetical protein
LPTAAGGTYTGNVVVVVVSYRGLAARSRNLNPLGAWLIFGKSIHPKTMSVDGKA